MDRTGKMAASSVRSIPARRPPRPHLGRLMFDNLSEKLQRVFKNLRGEGKLSAENMEAALREIRLALLEADVNFRVVKQLIENIKVKAMGEEVLTALSPSQQVIKIVHDELIKILGSHESKLRFANEPPSVFLIVGLAGLRQNHLHRQAGALAFANGHRPMMVSVDVYRPAAREQLKVIARESRPAHLRRRAGRERCRSIWRARRAARKPSTPGATCCWWIPPAACISTTIS